MVTNTPQTGPGASTGRRLVVCCDGTSNQPDRNVVTNVVKFARGVVPQDSKGASQIVFYEWGVGTSGKLDAITGGAFGTGLGKNVQSAYRFIVHNYQPGDQIYLLGFSRGAFTARSVAGFIRQCGIIRKEHARRIPEGYAFYRAAAVTPNDPESETWRQNYSHPIPLIEFVGVWDTVGALGIPAHRIIEALKYWTWGKWSGNRKIKMPPTRPGQLLSLGRNRHSFHDMQLSKYVKNAYHALAIDERRPVFTPAIWDSRPQELPDGSNAKQVMRQVWFPGAHSNVGGNSNVNSSSQSLSWMAKAAEASGLEFGPAFWTEVQQDIAKPGPISGSPPGLWRFAGAQLRDMSGNSGGTECIHNSARDRQQNTSLDYKPDNLANSTLPDC